MVCFECDGDDDEDDDDEGRRRRHVKSRREKGKTSQGVESNRTTKTTTDDINKYMYKYSKVKRKGKGADESGRRRCSVAASRVFV